MCKSRHWDGGAVLALAACATGLIETARTVPGDPAAARVRLEAELSRLGFRLASGSPDTSLEATADTAAVDWAACTPVLVGSDGGERSGEWRPPGGDGQACRSAWHQLTVVRP